MRSWQPLSDKFETSNGFVVEPVGSQDALRAMGEHFHNGLMVHHDTWASLCQRGRRQIFHVLDGEGTMIANGELEVKDGKVRAMFVRGQQNAEFTEGDDAYAAVASYLDAVNGGALDLNVQIARTGFTDKADRELTPWQQAAATAAAQVMTPFLALVAGNDVEAAEVPRFNPEADAVEQIEWPALSGPHRAENGLVVEPIRTRSALRTVGEELENNLILMHGSMAEACRTGRKQYAVIYDDAEGIIGVTELDARAGKIIPVVCRGRFDEEASTEVKAALDDFVAAVNEQKINVLVEIGERGFAVPDAQEVESDLEGEPAALLFPASRNPIFDDAYDSDYDDDWDDDNDDVPAANAVVADPLTWTALTDRFEASNGLVVEPVSDQESLRLMGVELHNALSSMHRAWAGKCQQGTSQIVRILDSDGKLVANAELHSYSGVVKPEFNRGLDNAPASAEANEALDEWCTAVNERRIAMNGTVGEHGFEFEEPQPRCGM